MGIYGIDVYAQTRFGRDPDLVRPDFSVDPFVATALDYATLHINWQKPNSTDCTYLRLVRNTRNVPLDQDDGYQVFDVVEAVRPPEGPPSDFGDPAFSLPVETITQFTDTGLGAGFQYYSMFGWDGPDPTSGTWVRCSDLIGLVPVVYDYADRLYNLLPIAYRDADILLVDPYNPWPVEEPEPPLQRYLSLLGFELDFIRTELESLKSVNDAMNCSGALLPLLAQELGLPNEPVIGMQQERLLIQNAIHLYKLKGSPQGISEFVSLLTGYPMAVITHHGYNNLLTRDDSVAEDNIGTWQLWPPPSTGFHQPIPPNATGITLTQVDLADVSESLPMTNPLENYPGFEPGPNPPYNNTAMEISATGAGDRWITTGAIPITDFMSADYGPGFCTWQISIWSATARQIRLSVWGDNGHEFPWFIVREQTFTETAGHWTVMTVTANCKPYPNGIANPNTQAAFYWMYPVIHIRGAAADENHYVTLMGLWPCTPGDIGVNTPIYDYPRDVKVIVSPQEANLLSNTLTNFGHGFDGLTPATDPLAPSINFSCDLFIHYASTEDLSPEIVNGIAALQVLCSGPNSTVWFGLVDAFGPVWNKPSGWFSDPSNDWFPNQVELAPGRTWFNDSGWFTTSGDYFTVGAPTYQGNWFPPPEQPPVTGNLVPFALEPGHEQPFNFSVYAAYQFAQDPSNAKMQIGFRWYYPDGQWVEVFQTPQLTQTMTRYSLAPPDPTQYYLGTPPPEPANYPNPGTLPNAFFPFVRFPFSQRAQFILNSAMLSPTPDPRPYFDITMFPGNSDYVEGPHGESYYFQNRDARMLRLESELYRWIPAGASHTEVWGTAGSIPALDPTEWLHPAMVLRGTTILDVEATMGFSGTVVLEADTTMVVDPS